MNTRFATSRVPVHFVQKNVNVKVDVAATTATACMENILSASFSQITPTVHTGGSSGMTVGILFDKQRLLM